MLAVDTASFSGPEILCEIGPHEPLLMSSVIPRSSEKLLAEWLVLLLEGLDSAIGRGHLLRTRGQLLFSRPQSR